MKNIRRVIPSIDKLLNNNCFKNYPRKLVLEILRTITNKWREEKSHRQGGIPIRREKIPANLEKVIIKEALAQLKVGNRCICSLQKVINATGVILNTNLGRAPMSKTILESFNQICSSYSNLEFDLETGERSDRQIHIEDLLKKLTNGEASIVVNNNASAVLLILDTFAKGKEAIVSRGELIEIGGSFRLPDILSKSGCKLVEVGTTNRTYIEDYEKKITKNTALLLKAHTSNYKILGFTHTPSLKEIVELQARLVGKKHNILTVEDLGSGLLIDLTQFNIPYEPTIQASINSGVDIISFSGDKLLGGPQCGIIIGKQKYIKKLRDNSLFRALRVDKFTLVCLEALLRIYLYEDDPISKIPHLSMIKEPIASVKARAQKLYNGISKVLVGTDYNLSLQKSEAEIGGGTYPAVTIPSFSVTIASLKHSPETINTKLRKCEPPIISRIANDKVWLDLRTIFENEINQTIEGMKKWEQKK